MRRGSFESPWSLASQFPCPRLLIPLSTTAPRRSKRPSGSSPGRAFDSRPVAVSIARRSRRLCGTSRTKRLRRHARMFRSPVSRAASTSGRTSSGGPLRTRPGHRSTPRRSFGSVRPKSCGARVSPPTARRSRRARSAGRSQSCRRFPLTVRITTPHRRRILRRDR